MDSDDDNPWSLDFDEVDDNVGNDETKNDDYDDYATTHGAQHVLIMIDCHPSMWEPTLHVVPSSSSSSANCSTTTTERTEQQPSSGGRRRRQLWSPVQTSLHVSLELLQSQIKTIAMHKRGRRDGIGIVLYNLPSAGPSDTTTGSGTASSRTTSTTRLLLPLAPPGIEHVRLLRNLLVTSSSLSYDDNNSSTTTAMRTLQQECGIVRTSNDNNDENNETRTRTNTFASSLSVITSLRTALQEADKVFNQAKCVKERATTTTTSKTTTTNRKTRDDVKSVWIFTNNDDPLQVRQGQQQPHGSTNNSNTNTEDERRRVYKAATDIKDNGVELYLWPMLTTTTIGAATGATNDNDNNTKKKKFDGQLFYNDILTVPPIVVGGQEQQEEEGGSDIRHILDMQHLMDCMQRNVVGVRTAFSFPMVLPPAVRRCSGEQRGRDDKDEKDDVGIQIDVYRVVQLQTKPQPMPIHQETKKRTVKVTQWLDEVTSDIVKSTADTKDEAKARRDDHPIETVTFFGGKTVVVTSQQVADIKKHANAHPDQPASLVLRGFKPLDALPMHYAVEKSLFLYPNDDKIKGSGVAFSNLHASMLRKGVMAIGELLTRATATSRLVAIYPQQAEYVTEEEECGGVSGGSGEQVTPPGMIAVVLPFEDDVRALEPDSGCATEESVQAAMEMMNRMKFGNDFALDYFRNDSLVNFYTYMESIALETALPTPEQTLTQITDDDVRNQAGDQIDAFAASLPEDIVVEKESKKRKRAPDESGCDWLALYKADSIDECTAIMLKQYLKSVGERSTGRKAELVERVSLSIGERIKNGELQDV